MKTKHENLTKRIKAILIDNEAARDDRMLTTMIIHRRELDKLGLGTHQYYFAIYEKMLSSFKCIDRIWVKIQHDTPELRGANWLKRKHQSAEIAIEIATEKQ